MNEAILLFVFIAIAIIGMAIYAKWMSRIGEIMAWSGLICLAVLMVELSFRYMGNT